VNHPVTWHELECGSYRADLPLWLELAAACGEPVLDVGAGVGRVALELARAGHAVSALDRDRALLAVLAHRSAGLAIETVCADAREFRLQRRFPLVLVPMQTIQLLGGPTGRRAFMRCARAHLAAGGLLAIAIVSRLEPFERGDEAAGPPPEVCERDGFVYRSQPTAVRVKRDWFELERRRELIAPDGRRTVECDRLRLDRVSARSLELEGERCGLRPEPRRAISPTADHVGSEVVILGG
jgi:SAM-dependent methyltransferase